MPSGAATEGEDEHLDRGQAAPERGAGKFVVTHGPNGAAEWSGH